MNLPELCRQIVTWHQKGKVEDFPKEAILLRQGPSSIAFIPQENPDCVVKVIKPGETPRGLSIEEEFGWMERLQTFQSPLSITPRPLSWGSNPAYLAMKRLGKNFDRTLSTADISRIGRAWGEFAGQLYLKYNAIHDDICLGNYTNEADGKIGIIDIASIRETDIPEKMFLTPLLDPINICPAMAARFEQITGCHIDFDLVTQLSLERLPGLLQSKSPEDAAWILGRQTANLEEWDNLLRADVARHSPGTAFTISNPR